MKSLKHEWSKNELIIAYYVAKWDYNGIGISDEDIVDSVIPNSTVQSLKMQVANFRYLLNIEGYKLTDASKMMKEIVDEMGNKGMDDVRRMVINFVQKFDLNVGRISRKNKEVESRRQELNRLEQEKYERRLKELGKYRRLVPINC